MQQEILDRETGKNVSPTRNRTSVHGSGFSAPEEKSGIYLMINSMRGVCSKPSLGSYKTYYIYN